MQTLSVFNSQSLDGYFTGENGDLSWAHGPAVADREWTDFVAGNAAGAGRGGGLLFGRVTYEMMVSYWPTPKAKQDMPAVAEGMNNATKYVVSRSLDTSPWTNTTVLKGDLAAEIRKLKQKSGPGIVILGSGKVVAQLTREGLIDAYTVVVVPVTLGKGRTMFEGLDKPLALTRTSERTFKNGNVVLTYEPKR